MDERGLKYFNIVKARYANDAPLGQGHDGSLVYIDDIYADEHENNDTTTMSEESLKYFVFASIISAENDEFTEEVKQEIISRYNPDEKWEDHDWRHILEPIGDNEKIDKLVGILK